MTLLVTFKKRPKADSSRKEHRKAGLTATSSSSLFSNVFASPKTVKRDSTAIANLSEDDESDDAVIEEDPVPGMISIFVSSSEEDRQVLQNALSKNQRVGDIFLDLPKHWSSQHVSSFSTWAIKLGLRRTYFGIQVRLSIPHGHIANLRRCITTASRLTSSDESSRMQTTLLNSSTTLTADPPSSLSQSRLSELTELSYSSLRQLCKNYQLKTTGRKQELIDRIFSVENAVRQGLSIREERSISSYAPSTTPIPKVKSRDHRPMESLSDDESLLHQLRREEFERNHQNQDYYHDANGHYNISLDDQSSFSDVPSLAATTFISPNLSRVNHSLHSPQKSVVDTSSFLGDLPRFSVLQKKLHRRRVSIMEFQKSPQIANPLISSEFHRLSLLHWILPYVSSLTVAVLKSVSMLVKNAVDNWSMNETIDQIGTPGVTSLSKESFLSEYTSGELIGEGGYKIVFQVQSSSDQDKTKRAMGVMDLESLRQNDLLVVAQQELRFSILCSLLSSHSVIPQFPQFFRIFRTSFPPPFVSIQSPSSDYLYFVMELANRSDLEHVLRTIELQDRELVACFFQMVLSLYVASQGLELVHYDVKLLNFLLQETAGSGQKYSLPWGTFFIPALNGSHFIVKLNDFGTAELNQKGEISVGQFTTLENTPAFYLLEPNPIRGSQSDVWCLGLCLLHMLTGRVPYEEWMEECRCPAGFSTLVKSYWKSKSSEFCALRKVLEDDENDVLALTLYRQLVLWFRIDMASDLIDSALWKRLHSILTRDSIRSKKDRAIRESFENDAKHYSWLYGDHPLLCKARACCQRIPGVESVLLNLIQFNWRRQMSFEDLLKDEMFHMLKQPITNCSTQYNVDIEKIHEIMCKSL